MSVIRSGSEQDRNYRGNFLPGIQEGPRIFSDRSIEKLQAAIGGGKRGEIELVVSYSLPKPNPVDSEEMQKLERRLARALSTSAAKTQSFQLTG